MSCRWCGSSSHNRTTCAKRVDYIKNNPDSWEARRHAERKSSPRSGHRCSWCRESGHVKNKCNIMINDIIELTNKNKAFRKEALEYMKSKGLGIGALVECDNVWGYDRKGEYKSHKKTLGLVTDINWNAINYPIGSIPSVMVEFMNVYESLGETKHKGLYEVEPVIVYNSKQPENPHPYYGNKIGIVSPGHVMIDNEAEWLKGHINKNELDRTVSGQRQRGHQWATNVITRNKLF